MKRDPVKALVRALKKLVPDQGRVARRNARHRVIAALKAVRTNMDKDFPATRLKPKERRRLTDAMKQRKLRRKGWQVFNHQTDAFAVGLLAQAGIRVRRLNNAMYVPFWVNMMPFGRPHEHDTLLKLRLLKKDVCGQKALVAEHVLAHDYDVPRRMAVHDFRHLTVQGRKPHEVIALCQVHINEAASK